MGGGGGVPTSVGEHLTFAKLTWTGGGRGLQGLFKASKGGESGPIIKR